MFDYPFSYTLCKEQSLFVDSNENKFRIDVLMQVKLV